MPNLPYTSSAWTTHNEVKLREIAYPLPADATGIVITRTYEGPKANYAPLAFGSLDPEYNANANLANAYLVEQGDLEDASGGQVRYIRRYATVPAQQIEYQDYAFTFPAYSASRSGNVANVTAMSYNSSPKTVTLTATTSGIANNDVVYVSVRYTEGTRNYAAAFYRRCSNVTGTALTVPADGIIPSGSYSSVSGTVQKGTPGRTIPKTVIIPSRIVTDFAYTTDPATDLPIAQPFRPVVTLSGEDATSLSTLTTPTAADYGAVVASEGLLVAECSLSRWMGDIYQRRTRYVPAQ